MKIIKTKQSPLPESKIMAQTENYRLVQSYVYWGDEQPLSPDPFAIIPFWFIEKKHITLLKEKIWVAYENKPRMNSRWYCSNFIIEYFKLMNPDERLK